MKIISLLLCFFLSAEAGYRSEGFSSCYDGDKRVFLLSIYLPYHPKILSFSNKPEIGDSCAHSWPEGIISYDSSNKGSSYDLLWLDQESGEEETLALHSDFLSQAKVIYTSTHLHDGGIHFQRLKEYIDRKGFAFLTHWYWEEKDGHAIFVRKDIYEASMRSIIHDPSLSISLLPPRDLVDLQTFFRPAVQKTNNYQWDEIDFIYMINLDERPEKFALAAHGLQLYGINPYRFSAVNGWKLPTEVLMKVGATFPKGSCADRFFGLTYKQINGKERLHYEFMRDDGTSYFTPALARGPVGIVLSHLSVLQDAYDSGYQTIWVMEDDVEVIGDPSQIPHLIRTLDRLVPTWDIFFTDTDTKENTVGHRIPCRALAARPNVPIPPLSSFLDRFYSVGEGFSRTGMRYGAYSMIVRRSGMKKILDYYKTYGIFLPYDMDFWLCPNLTMFHYEKDSVSHRVGSLSDNGSPSYEKKQRVL